MKNLYLQFLDKYRSDPGLVLTTVTRTHGSAPQKPGSSAFFSGEGLLCGTIGGGVVEGRVRAIATGSLLSKKSDHILFNLANDISNTEEAICGGNITILIDASPGDSVPVFEQMKQSLSERIPGVLVTMVNSSANNTVLIKRHWISGSSVPGIPGSLLKAITPVVTEILKSGSSAEFREMELPPGDEETSSVIFLEPVIPPVHLVIAGAGHIGKALSHLGSMLGFEVTVIDDRPEYANSDTIPDADHIIVKDIGSAMYELPKGRDTYVVIVTRGHKDDAEALKPCFGSSPGYIGMIGSRKKVATMRTSFIDKGWTTIEQWDSIFAPVGFDIGSKTVEEIAVSIAAQLIQVRSGKK